MLWNLKQSETNEYRLDVPAFVSHFAAARQEGRNNKTRFCLAPKPFNTDLVVGHRGRHQVSVVVAAEVAGATETVTSVLNIGSSRARSSCAAGLFVSNLFVHIYLIHLWLPFRKKYDMKHVSVETYCFADLCHPCTARRKNKSHDMRGRVQISIRINEKV